MLIWWAWMDFLLWMSRFQLHLKKSLISMGLMKIFFYTKVMHLSSGIEGLIVVDIFDPAYPEQIGVFPTSGSDRDVFISQGYAYVASWNGLRVLDVSNPEDPVVVGLYDPGYINSVVIIGSYAYVTSHIGAYIVDVSEPTNPVLTGTYEAPGPGADITVSGNFAYVADGNFGLRVVDVTDPTNPIEVAFCNTPSEALGVKVQGEFAFVADESSGLRIIDVSDPYHPVEVSSVVTSHDVADVAVSGNYAYLAEFAYTGAGGLRVVDISNLMDPVDAGFYETDICLRCDCLGELCVSG